MLTRRRSSGPALGSVRNHADNGRPFDAGEQQTGQHSGINEQRAVGTSVGLCWISTGLLPAIAGAWSKESRAHACHRSSHRVENLAVSLRPRAQASPLGADVIDTSHSDLTVSAVPRHTLTFLSVVFRGMVTLNGASQI
jgi:hypothetical protein